MHCHLCMYSILMGKEVSEFYAAASCMSRFAFLHQRREIVDTSSIFRSEPPCSLMIPTGTRQDPGGWSRVYSPASCQKSPHPHERCRRPSRVFAPTSIPHQMQD